MDISIVQTLLKLSIEILFKNNTAFSLLHCRLHIFVYLILLLKSNTCKRFFWRCHVVVYVVMGVVVAFGSSPSAYIRGLTRRIDRGVPNAASRCNVREPITW